MASYKLMNEEAIAAYKLLPKEDQVAGERFCNSTLYMNEETLRDTSAR